MVKTYAGVLHTGQKRLMKMLNSNELPMNWHKIFFEISFWVKPGLNPRILATNVMSISNSWPDYDTVLNRESGVVVL